MSNDRRPILDYSNVANEPLKWKTIASYANVVEANLAILKLQDAGVRARTDGENTAILGPYSGAAGGARVQVIEHDVETARKILAEVEEARKRRRERDDAKPNCPACGDDQPAKVIWPGRWVGGAMLVAGIIGTWLAPGQGILILLILAGVGSLFWPVAQRWKCAACGNRWQAKPNSHEEADTGEREAE
jgi:hypothetical protein